MRVLVTGHLGYIGSVMVPMMLKKGFEVVGLDSDLYRRCVFGSWSPQVENIEKDVRDVTLDDLRGFDAICHLAGLSNDPLGDLDPNVTYEINYQATVRLATLAKEARIDRFVFSSSCSCYGASEGDSWLCEDSPLYPVTPYAESKVLSEKALSDLAGDNFSPVFLRNATAYGVSPRLRFDLVLNNLTAWAVTTGKIMMKSDGTPWRPLVHITDIVRAFIAVLKAPRDLIHKAVFNVGRDEDNLQVRDIAKIVGKTVPGCEVGFADGASPDKRNYRVSCKRLPKLIPTYKPRWNTHLGASELFNAYEKYSIKLEDFEGVRFQRIGHIKQLIAKGELTNDMRFK